METVITQAFALTVPLLKPTLEVLLQKWPKRNQFQTLQHAESIGIEKGSTFVLVGENGSGKSMFLRILAGLIEKDASKLRVILEVVDLVIIIGGLGGGLASGAIPVITRIAKE